MWVNLLSNENLKFWNFSYFDKKWSYKAVNPFGNLVKMRIKREQIWPSPNLANFFNQKYCAKIVSDTTQKYELLIFNEETIKIFPRI